MHSPIIAPTTRGRTVSSASCATARDEKIHLHKGRQQKKGGGGRIGRIGSEEEGGGGVIEGKEWDGGVDEEKRTKVVENTHCVTDRIRGCPCRMLQSVTSSISISISISGQRGASAGGGAGGRGGEGWRQGGREGGRGR